MGYDINLGVLNGHATGRILKEAVRRAMVAIRTERIAFEAHIKLSYGGTMDDVFTSADTKAQQIYLRTLQECFADCGVIAEEDELTMPGKNQYIFTVDPLDGTKAFVRRQSHGVGTMIALVNTTYNEVDAAYIGDINTGEVYGYRPGSDKVWRINQLDTFERLDYQGGAVLSEQYALLRDPEGKYSDLTLSTLAKFKNHEVGGGSIGIWAARLWKREVAALFYLPGWETPWDSNPVIGISKKLGYVFLGRMENSQEGWVVFNPPPVLHKFRRNYEMLIVHKADLAQILPNYRG
jgi:fructose-1,6-bisphosphatase/inositol monophosphatase family enzyme